MTSPLASYVLTKSSEEINTYTAISANAAITEFDIKPRSDSMTLVCSRPVKTSVCVLEPGYNELTGCNTVQKMIAYMLEKHNFPEEQKGILKKSL